MNLRPIIFGILVGAAVMGVMWVLVEQDLLGRNDQDAPEEFQRLAVLPLADPNGDAAELGGMIAQELTTQLTQMGLPMIPWIRTQGYSPEEVDEAGTELGTDGLVAGSLSIEDGRVRGTVRLHDLAGGSRGWDLEIDAPMAEPMFTGRFIARKIARHFEDPEDPGLEPEEDPQRFVDEGWDALWEETKEGDERAKDLFMRALEIDPGVVDAYIGMATYYSRQGSDAGNQEALAMYELALELDPASAAARRGLVDIYWSLRLYEKGLAVVKTMPGNMDRFDRAMIAGEAYAKCQLPDRAVPFYKKALSLKPEDPGAKWGLAYAYTWSGRYREAVDLQLEFFEEFGEDKWLSLFTSEAYFGLGIVDSSIYFAEKWQRLVESSSDYPTEYLLADLYESKGDNEKAHEVQKEYVREASDYLSRNPDADFVRLKRAVYYAKLGDRDKYLADMELAITQAQGDGRMCWNVGFALAEVGEVGRAIDFIRQGLELGYWSYQGSIRADGKGQMFLAAQALVKHPEWPALEAEILAKEEELWQKYGIE